MELAETEAQQPGNLEEGAYLMKHTTTRYLDLHHPVALLRIVSFWSMISAFSFCRRFFSRTFKEGDKRSMRTKVRIALMGLVKHVQQVPLFMEISFLILWPKFFTDLPQSPTLGLSLLVPVKEVAYLIAKYACAHDVHKFGLTTSTCGYALPIALFIGKTKLRSALALM